MRTRICLVNSLLFLAVLLGMMGCHTVPLGNPETSTADANLAGWWEADQPGTLIHVRLYDPRTFVVTAYGYTEKDAVKPDVRLTTKAWLTPVGGMDVMTFQIINPEWDLEEGEKANACYSYYRIRKVETGIEAMPLNIEFLKDTKTPEELAKKIADNVTNAALWKDKEPLVLRHLTADKLEHVKKIVKAFETPKGE